MDYRPSILPTYRQREGCTLGLGHRAWAPDPESLVFMDDYRVFFLQASWRLGVSPGRHTVI